MSHNAEMNRAETGSSHVGTCCGAIQRLVTGWAIAGGLLLMAIIAINVFSVVGGLFGHPFPGDMELTEMGVAIAAFTFLPYAQVSGANVSADFFTARASPRFLAILTLLAASVAFLFSLLLLWRMALGLADQKAYGYTTTILEIPHWIAFIPILISLAFLALAAIATMLDTRQATIKGGQDV